MTITSFSPNCLNHGALIHNIIPVPHGTVLPTAARSLFFPTCSAILTACDVDVFFPVQADSSSYANYQSLNSQQPAKSVSVGGPNAVLEIRAWNARSMALFAY
ncbi:hypothetical protein PENARI_c211G03934 [Penicillium arizonense]|uniref:Uncharacterized protein n=1 Tax=Penicillium arizonense TaxID=1835702 RepID=A0A1F5L0L6_PENAI|nr:hypothetical protein PENARI_c211G03934 [Penicillium arizonense]OGE46520.1 hypothetical protein PENARI_c211G03934 [Penicillium arizonense]